MNEKIFTLKLKDCLSLCRLAIERNYNEKKFCDQTVSVSRLRITTCTGMAMDALFMPIQTNTYLINGHNYQDERLTIYLPGNGGLLSAVAMMCAGYDGCTINNPGFPKDGSWKVKWEGMKKIF